MINITKLVYNWKVLNSWKKEDVEHESERLYNAIWALYENGLITAQDCNIQLKKLKKAVEEFNK